MAEAQGWQKSKSRRQPQSVAQLNPVLTKAVACIRQEQRLLRISGNKHLHKGGSEEEDLSSMAEVAFAALVTAYEVLGTPDKRAAFDDYGDGLGDLNFDTPPGRAPIPSKRNGSLSSLVERTSDTPCLYGPSVDSHSPKVMGAACGSSAGRCHE